MIWVELAAEVLILRAEERDALLFEGNLFLSYWLHFHGLS